ncbi:MAG: hypothetical protein FD175_3044 [Beijerinckiaceae bacterium]|nr:MAG: hypothetical protein FD175_3044 [Beijerinckiaceae bacterium]
MAFIIRPPAFGGIFCGLSEDLPLDKSKIYRGDPIPSERFPENIAIYARKNAKIPDIFFFYDAVYLCCSKEGRDFIEKYAPGDCDFSIVDAHYGRGGWTPNKAKLGVKLEREYFFLNTKSRLDTIDWIESKAKSEKTWIYRAYSDEKIWGTNIQWPILDESGIERAFEGLVIRKSLRKGVNIWRENMAGWQLASCIFISDEIRQLIQKEKIGRFEYIPVMEI